MDESKQIAPMVINDSKVDVPDSDPRTGRRITLVTFVTKY